MKRDGLVALPGVVLVTLVLIMTGLAGAAPVGTSVFSQMTELESKRSLGDGRLALFLASPDEAVAVRAALAIGRTKRRSGAQLLAAHLDDSRVAVRAMSVYGL